MQAPFLMVLGALRYLQEQHRMEGDLATFYQEKSYRALHTLWVLPGRRAELPGGLHGVTCGSWPV